MDTLYMYFQLKFTWYRVKSKTENLANKNVVIARNGTRTQDPQMSLIGFSFKSLMLYRLSYPGLTELQREWWGEPSAVAWMSCSPCLCVCSVKVCSLNIIMGYWCCIEEYGVSPISRRCDLGSTGAILDERHILRHNFNNPIIICRTRWRHNQPLQTN